MAMPVLNTTNHINSQGTDGTYFNHELNATIQRNQSTAVMSTNVKIGMTSAYVIIFIIALLGNSLGLVVVSKKTPFNSVTNLFIANMAVADLLLTVTAMPFCVGFFYRGDVWFGGTLGTVTCKAMHYAIRISIAATVLAMTLISFDRFYVVFYPLKGKIFRKPRVVSALIWLLSFILMMPTLFFYKVQVIPSDNADVHVCRGGNWLSSHSRKIFHICLFCLLYAFPLMVMVVLYVLICRKLWPRKIPESVSGKSRAVVEMSKRKVVRLLIVIIVVFAFCWFPTYVNHYFFFIRPDQGYKLPAEVQYVFFWLAHANSAINPCLYILLSYHFRKRLVSMFVRCPCLGCF